MSRVKQIFEQQSLQRAQNFLFVFRLIAKGKELSLKTPIDNKSIFLILLIWKK